MLHFKRCNVLGLFAIRCSSITRNPEMSTRGWRSGVHGSAPLFCRLRKFTLTAFYLVEIVEQRLNAFETRVLAVSVCQLAQEVLTDHVVRRKAPTDFACNGWPDASAGLF